ncbi:hypothetical protein BJP37_31070 [Moorena bouillonii PNG]|uniref:Uncharacterized protein n=1 Tax=Moorena bouillonii PNG TaxID=568701 RepID=A0A1U7NA59_9CYAN|nr:hypothetical protein BJP37_31070 [Moorena bouillonii PNG]
MGGWDFANMVVKSSFCVQPLLVTTIVTPFSVMFIPCNGSTVSAKAVGAVTQNTATTAKGRVARPSASLESAFFKGRAAGLKRLNGVLSMMFELMIFRILA